MTDKPTPKEIEDLFVEETGFATDDFPAAILDFARAVLAKWGQPAQAAEPVSHQYQSKDGTWHEFIDQRHYNTTVASGGWPIRALYTAPQPVAREPLTPERVKEIVRGAGYDQCGIPDTERAAFINGLRHGEVAHGIGGTP